jgi:hypothetical protein
MLRTQYSPQLIKGMSSISTIGVLTQAWADQLLPDRPDADDVRREFISKIISNVHKFADEKGEVPEILIRSGRLTGDAVEQARGRMNWMLGDAHRLGRVVPKDEKQAEPKTHEAQTKATQNRSSCLGLPLSSACQMPFRLKSVLPVYGRG